ncbi:MAG: glycosyltransferase family 4 protein [Cyclobacteriaceae bacterium]
MKILIISNLYPSTEKIGNEIGNMLLHHYARHLVKNHQLTVINPHSYNLLEIFRRERFVRSFTLDGIKIFNRSVLRLPGDYLVKRKFRSVVDVKDCELLIGCLPVGLEIANYLSKKFHVPHISYLHITDFYRSGVSENKLTSKYRNFLQSAAGFAFISAKLQKSFQRHLGKGINQCILPGAISKEWVEALKDRTFELGDSVRIVTPSRIIQRKNIELILEALQVLDDDRLHFTLAGHGEHARKLEEKCREEALLDSSVSFVGVKTHSEIRELMDANDFMILLSVNESFGLVYLEAMARGSITIGTKGEGIDGVIEHGKNGFLCEPTTAALVELFKEILAMEPSQLSTVSKAGQVTAQQYLYENQAQHFVEFIEKCL